MAAASQPPSREYLNLYCQILPLLRLLQHYDDHVIDWFLFVPLRIDTERLVSGLAHALLQV